MKKAAIIISSIQFGITLNILFFFSLYLLNIDEHASSKEGVILLILTIVYLGIGLFLIIFTGKNVAAYNQTWLGILILIFICIPGGILIICLPHNSQIYDRMNSNQKTTGSGFSRLMYSRDNKGNQKCERCRRSIVGEGNTYIIISMGNKKTICKNCYYLAKERGENITLAKII